MLEEFELSLHLSLLYLSLVRESPSLSNRHLKIFDANFKKNILSYDKSKEGIKKVQEVQDH